MFMTPLESHKVKKTQKIIEEFRTEKKFSQKKNMRRFYKNPIFCSLYKACYSF
jgi:hypothetical protein